MKGAYITVLREFLQGNIAAKMTGHKFLGPLNGGEMVGFQFTGYVGIHAIISNIIQRGLYKPDYQAIDQQFFRLLLYCLQNFKMKQFGIGMCFEQGGVQVAVGEILQCAIFFQQLLVKFLFKIKNGAFVGNGMIMGNCFLATRFGEQHAAVIGIQ